MSKPRRSQNYKGPKVTDTKQKEKEKSNKRVWKIPYFPLLFIALWIFSSIIYGDVFYMSQQTSFFAWDSTIMFSVLNQNFGWIDAIGRFLLLAFHYPLLGGAILALMLTFSAWLLDYLLGNKGKLHWIPMLLPFAFLGYFIYLDYSINYMRETSLLMSVPFCSLVILALLTLAKRIVTRKHIPVIYKTQKEDTNRASLLTCAVVIVLFTGFTLYCTEKRENIIMTSKMQRMMEYSNWDSMIDEALSNKQPARSVAAYYALALAETGQLENRLFEIPYNFPETTVVAPDEKENDGVSIYSIDGDFYAGLVNSSYHTAMETLVRRGPQVFTLKRLARAAAMNGESELCHKYLEILSRCLVENEFVKRYSEYADNTVRMHAEPEFAHVAAKMPLDDSFEQNYRTPFFIGYNVALRGGRSSEALRTSIMACLYAKETDFLNRVILLRDSVLSPYMEQAITLQSMRRPQIMNGYHFDKKMNVARLQNFVNDARPWLKNKETEKGFEALKGAWLNFYPFYLYFQNFPKTKKIQQKAKGGEGVN